MKQFVISGINLFEGGPLSIYYDCLDAVNNLQLYKEFEIVAFVHKKSLFKKYESNITLIELPKSRKSYLNRFYYEYVYFKRYSLKHDVSIWISLHDMTPRVRAEKLFTYCHNVSPFIKKDLKNIRYSITNVLFSYFYKYIYRLNIKKATGIIVQTQWMRDAFFRMYPVNNVIVARPSIEIDYPPGEKESNNSQVTSFIYPAFPRYFKNFEIICEAAKELNAEECKIFLTLDGSENAYANEIYNKYKDVKSIVWLGLRPREEIFKLYNSVDCLIFPSTMETWGLPISEFKLTGKDMIIIDLPYARETLGSYNKAMFFQNDNPHSLLKCMRSVINHSEEYSQTSEQIVNHPVVNNWEELLKHLIYSE